MQTQAARPCRFRLVFLFAAVYLLVPFSRLVAQKDVGGKADNIINQSKQPVDPNTIFCIGSVSKALNLFKISG